MGKKKVPKGKVWTGVYLSEEVYKLLIELAPLIYGRYKGAISYVVEEALKQYLYPRKHTQKHTNPKLSVKKVYYQVCEKIKELLDYPAVPDQVKEWILDRAIMEVRGSDPRTIKKWKELFEKAGLIKFIGGREPKRTTELI